MTAQHSYRESSTSKRVLGSLSSGLVSAFCRVIGDDNPVHSDREVARLLGLEETTIPGSLLSVIMLDEVERRVGIAEAVEVKFSRWAYTGETLTLQWLGDGVQIIGGDGRRCARARLTETAPRFRRPDREQAQA